MSIPKKHEYLLVDGYNIIYAWDDLARTAQDSLEDARRELAHILTEYAAMTKRRVILVYDAHNVKRGTGNIERLGGVQIVYTREAETADHYIERAASRLAREYEVRVATSDILEQVIILSRGAYRITADEFWDEVVSVKAQVREMSAKLKPIKRNMLMDNLDERTAEQLEKMRRGKGRSK